MCPLIKQELCKFCKENPSEDVMLSGCPMGLRQKDNRNLRFKLHLVFRSPYTWIAYKTLVEEIQFKQVSLLY